MLQSELVLENGNIKRKKVHIFDASFQHFECIVDLNSISIKLYTCGIQIYRLRTPIQWPPAKSSNVEIDNSFIRNKKSTNGCKNVRARAVSVLVSMLLCRFHFIYQINSRQYRKLIYAAIYLRLRPRSR